MCTKMSVIKSSITRVHVITEILCTPVQIKTLNNLFLSLTPLLFQSERSGKPKVESLGRFFLIILLR